MTLAVFGYLVLLLLPTLEILLPLITTTASGSGAPPLPSMTVPPTSTSICSDCGQVELTRPVKKRTTKHKNQWFDRLGLLHFPLNIKGSWDARRSRIPIRTWVTEVSREELARTCSGIKILVTDRSVSPLVSKKIASCQAENP
jgi:hypothetical protein